MSDSKTIPATVLIIFGASGDLIWRKIAPALFDLSRTEMLPEQFAIVGVGRSQLDDHKLRERLKSGIAKFAAKKPDAKQWKKFARQIFYVRGDYQERNTYRTLSKKIASLEKNWSVPPSLIFYLATPPALFAEIPPRLDEAGLIKDREQARLVVEKPFGRDLDSARQLNERISRYFAESQIFRIDHFLGKETVQNLLAFRFANPMFEPIWNRQYVDYVTITAAEQLGVGHRGSYFEHAGALRDMVQNHLMQLFCLVAMEPMNSFAADEVRNKKLDALRAVRPIPQDEVRHFAARGQYGPGWIEGRKVPAYRQEPDVARTSQTETFMALKLLVENWRWKGVPFYLRTGKRLARSASEISIHFRAVPHQAFPREAMLEWESARLIILIQPDEGIILRFQAKQPGPGIHLRNVNMRFDYARAFGGTSPDAYETLLLDVMENDPTLFMRFDQVEASWRILQPVQNAWAIDGAVEFPNYAAGSWGPVAAAELLAIEGHTWPRPSVLGESCASTATARTGTGTRPKG